MTTSAYNPMEHAVQNLRKFFIRKAEDYKHKMGVAGYEESDDAPQDWEGIKAQFKRGAVAKVSKTGLETSLFGGGFEYALRFWHDALHMVLNKTLSFEDEIAVAIEHVKQTEEEFGIGSLEANIMAADAFGQTLYHRLQGGFVADQHGFTLAFARVMCNTEQWKEPSDAPGS